MQNVVNDNPGVKVSDLTSEQFRAFSSDPDLRRMTPNTPEFQAALNTKFGKKPEESATSVKSEGTGSEKVGASSPEPATSQTKTDEGEKPKWSKAAQRRIDDLMKEVGELRAKTETKKETKSEGSEAPTGGKFEKLKPELKDFTKDGHVNLVAFNEALTDWKLEKRDFDRDQREASKRAESEFKGKLSKFQAAGKEVEKELGLDPGDFDLLMSDKENFVFLPGARAALHESELGARLAIEIVRNEKTREEFRALSEVAQIRYIGRLEAKLEETAAAKTKQKQVVSGAKAPSTPLPSGSASVKSAKELGSPFEPGMSFKEYEAKRNEQRRAAAK